MCCVAFRHDASMHIPGRIVRDRNAGKTHPRGAGVTDIWKTDLADIVGDAVVVGDVGFQAALAVALHVWLGVHVRWGRVGRRAARAVGIFRPVTDLPYVHARCETTNGEARRRGSSIGSPRVPATPVVDVDGAFPDSSGILDSAIALDSAKYEVSYIIFYRYSVRSKSYKILECDRDKKRHSRSLSVNAVENAVHINFSRWRHYTTSSVKTLISRPMQLQICKYSF